MEEKTTPIFETLLNTLNARFNEYEELINMSSKVLDRLNGARVKDTPKVAEKPQDVNYEPTTVNRLSSLCAYFEQSNQSFKELYARLNELA